MSFSSKRVSKIILLSVGLISTFQYCNAAAFKVKFPQGQFFSPKDNVAIEAETEVNSCDMYIVSYDVSDFKTIPLQHGKPHLVELGKLPVGIYWLTEIDGKVVNSFAVIPDAVCKTDSEKSPFGVFYAYVDNPNMGQNGVAKMLDAMKSAGIGWVRCTTAITPDPKNQGKYDWTARDLFLDAACSRGIQVLSMFEEMNFPKAWKPLWKNPKTLEAIKDYVEHNKSRLKYFEVWNEANGNPRDYVKFHKECYKVIKKVNPDALVVQTGLASPAVSGQWNCELGTILQKDFISMGLDKYIDIYNFHYYPYQWKAEKIISQYMAIYNTIKNKKPIWVTENGQNAEFNDINSQKITAEYLVKSATTSFGMGVDKYFWFLIRDHPSFHAGLLDSPLRPKAPFVSYSVMTRMLDEAELEKTEKIEYKQFKGYRFKTPAGQVAVVWNENSGPAMRVNPKKFFKNGMKVSVYNIMGTEIPIKDGKIYLGQAPLYVVSAKAVHK